MWAHSATGLVHLTGWQKTKHRGPGNLAGFTRDRDMLHSVPLTREQAVEEGDSGR